MTKPTDPAGEKFDEAVAEAFDRDCMREDVFRDEPHEHNVAQAALRTAADTMAAERVWWAIGKFIEYRSEGATNLQARAALEVQLAALEAKEEK